VYLATSAKTTPSSSSKTVRTCTFRAPEIHLTTLPSQEAFSPRKQTHHQVLIPVLCPESSPHPSSRLNSTLSVKIEELNAQVSALYVENLRLRSSEIALSAQLKREKEKSRSIMADAEAAVSRYQYQYHTSTSHAETLTDYEPHETSRIAPRILQSPSWETFSQIESITAPTTNATPCNQLFTHDGSYRTRA
jgi:hypothetical protein